MDHMDLPTQWAQRIDRARRDLDAARAQHKTAAAAFDSAVHNAIEAGCQVAAVADAAQISRQTAYRAFERHDEWLHPQLV